MYTAITDEADQDVVIAAVARAEVPCFVEDKTMLVDTNACWPATETVKSTGYPRGHFHRKIVNKLFGKLERGIVVDHLCDNRPCINPTHLQVTTERINILRGRAISADYARRTNCHKCGLPLAGSNLILRADSHHGREKYVYRVCRACDDERKRKNAAALAARRRAARAARRT